MKQCYYKQEIHGRRYHQHKSDRSEFQRLIADCNAGLIDMVITKSLSRFSRNTVDTLNILRELKQKGVDVFFERENIHGSSGDGELILTILSSFLQEESRSVSENCDGYSKEDGTGGGDRWIAHYVRVHHTWQRNIDRAQSGWSNLSFDEK